MAAELTASFKTQYLKRPAFVDELNKIISKTS